ncbi:MAG: carbamoyltransferase N-terminal domain-containing protein, partial [Candidatus Subteraquimicrobiales bacterium]|nr:carbamoyltransferase N-terminal domain-containing protein [Candidatus Subteraquimicrobiales bacterium]
MIKAKRGHMKNKYILGLNGCHLRSHDAAACLIKNNQIIAIAEEERFIRQKRALDKQPICAAKFCLEKANIGVRDLSTIAIGFKLSKRRLSDISSILPKGILELDKKIPVLDIKHHLAHAASVFYTSGYKEAAILVVDGQGEDESTSIFYADYKCGITFLKSYNTSKSLGFLYSSISEFCGLGGFGAGKLMGLSAYGEPVYKKILNGIYSKVRLDNNNLPDNQIEFSSYVISQLIRKGFKPAKINVRFNEFTGKIEKMPMLLKVHKDLAASAQSFIEDKMLDLAREAKELTNSQNLCLSGGVALNCVANTVVENAKIFKQIFIQPACEDS